MKYLPLLLVVILAACAGRIEPTPPERAATATPAPTETPTATSPPGFEPVTTNDEWTPTIETFNGVEMALVPAGCFEMGSSEEQIAYVMQLNDYAERAWFEDEAPVHRVCFEEPFWIDVYEVTNEQIGEPGSRCIDWSSEDDQPRICIDWMSALAHCESRDARLPTGAEWEYAARGPDSLVYPWGNEFVADNVVYSENDPGGTAPVGSRPAGVSWVGVYNLSGNVIEWVSDWYDEDYYSTLTDGVVNPQGPEGDFFRALRGGSSVSRANGLHAASRGGNDPLYSGDGIGFRCARSYSPGR